MRESWNNTFTLYDTVWYFFNSVFFFFLYCHGQLNSLHDPLMGWNTLCWSFSTQWPVWWFYPTSCLKLFIGFPLHGWWNLEITVLSVRSCMIPLLLLLILYHFSTPFQFSLVTQSCPTLCDPMSCSTPGLPVHHQLPDPIQTHVHWVGDAIQQSHPQSSCFPPALHLS